MKVYIRNTLPFIDLSAVDGQKAVELDDGSTLYSLFKALHIPDDACDVCLCALNDRMCDSIQQPLNDGDVIRFMQLVEGG